MALLSKHGGGIGWDFSRIRGSGATIRGHKGVGGGVIPFLKPVNDVALAVDQLGCVDRDSFVNIVESVTTEDFTHNFQKRIQPYQESSQEFLDDLVAIAKSYSFSYGTFSKKIVGQLIENSIKKIPVEATLEEFNIHRQQYKKVMGQYRKIEKNPPSGFKPITGYPFYLINSLGTVLNSETLKPLSKQLTKKGYESVTLGKMRIDLHRVLYRTFISDYDSNNYTVDHIDGDKLNNSLDNLQLLSNEENISKGWQDDEVRQRRIEKSKISKFLSGTHKLNGDRRGWDTEIVDLKLKTIPITSVQTGDMIQSFNMESGEVEYKRVEKTHEVFVKHKDQISIKYSDGGYITTSNWHPLAIYEDGKYIYRRSDEVRIGDIGVDSFGKRVEIVEINNNPLADENYFDLTVEGNNNYFCSTGDENSPFHLIHNTRKGSINAYLEVWHWDIEDFLDLKKNSGEERRRAHDLFTSVWINDLFMERVRSSGSWSLFDPHEVMDLTDSFGDDFKSKYLQYETRDNLRKRTVSAKELWKKILLSYFETGSPFLGFKDESNRRNPNQHSGNIRSSNLCVTGDTRVLTENGYIRAETLANSEDNPKIAIDGRMLKEHSTKLETPLHKMVQTSSNEDVYQVTMSDGSVIKCTGYHEFPVVTESGIEKKPLLEMDRSEKIYIHPQETSFGSFHSPDLAFLMGLIAGDGTFSIDRRDPANLKEIVYIDLYDKSIHLAERVEKIVHQLIGDSNYKLPVFRSQVDSGSSKKLRLGSTRLARVLARYGFVKDTKLRVPDIIFQSSKDTIIAYLKGLYTTDGTVNRIKNSGNPSMVIQLNSISNELLQETRVLLSMVGIRGRIYYKPSVNSTLPDGKGGYANYQTKPQYRLDCNGDNALVFRESIGFESDEKNSRCDEVIIEREANGSKWSRKPEKWETQISTVEYIGREPVYDLTSDSESHTVVFDGIVTGNCMEILQNTSPAKYQVQRDFIEKNEKVGEGETAVCNLASINLSKIHKREDIERVVPVAIRMLDNVIDLNFYPIEATKYTNLKNRAIGLGVMGEAQMLAENLIEFGTDRHLEMIDEVMENVSYNAIRSSSKLAVEKGAYPNYNGSLWSKGIFPIDTAHSEAKKLTKRELSCDWDKLRKEVAESGMRNGYLMAIAPTSSISILSGTTQAVEPVYKRKWFEENLSGMIPVTAPNLNSETWFYYKPVYEVDQVDLVRAGAVRQKWLDQAQSLNIFINPDTVTGGRLHKIYMTAWSLGVKTTYYLRSKSPETESIDRSDECLVCQ
jgi:ribonucleotide reductase alpha subunit